MRFKAENATLGGSLAVGLALFAALAAPSSAAEGVRNVGPNRASIPTHHQRVDQSAAVLVPTDVLDRAPRIRLHPDEQFWPMSSHTWFDHSDLKWAHDESCPDDSDGDPPNGIIDATPEETPLGNGGYSHVPMSGWPSCNHEGSRWYSNENVRPHEDGGVSGGEGMYLNLNNDWHDGQGFQTDEPVYYVYHPGVRITYWFPYAYSQTLDVFHHEGDWERISIRLNSNNQPQEIEYFQHHTSCTLDWDNAPRVNGRPIIWVAKEAHGSYPAGADAHSGDKIDGSGPIWYGQTNLDAAPQMDWYGYGGAWGDTGNISDTTGPAAPPWKSVPDFSGTNTCDMS